MTENISQNIEDYLEAIYLLKKEKKEVRTKDIASRLGVSMPSVTEMCRKLSGIGLLKYERYGSIELALKGKNTAKNTYEKHRFLTEFFTSLGIDKKMAAKDACRAEHALSRKAISKLKEFVNEKGKKNDRE